MRTLIFFAVTAVLFAGCASGGKNEPELLSNTRNPRVSPQQVTAAHARNNPPAPQPTSAEVVTNPTPNESAYLLPGTSHLYFSAPYRDPFNPRLIHGDHVMVRAEEDPRPLLASASARRIIVGNAAVGDLHQAPAVLDRELAEELGRDRYQREEMQKVIGATTATLDQMRRENVALMRAYLEQLAYSKKLQDALADKSAKPDVPLQPAPVVPPKK